MSKVSTDYFYVHGQAYDLKSYADFHPGGKTQLLTLQGRDCTEMVYSMHALTSINKVKSILEKYKVQTPKNSLMDTFNWSENGLYGTLKQRAQEYFQGLNGKDTHKSNNMFWFITAIEIAVHLLLFYWWIAGGSYLCPLLAGLITCSLGLMVLHTAGHNAISKNPKVNTFWYKLYANYFFGFVSGLWNIHHNYGHHAYTNIHRKDPDVSNTLAVVRKSPHQAIKPQHKAQWYTAYLLLVFMPNQWVGQIIQYWFALKRGKIFGLPLLDKGEKNVAPFYGFFSVIFCLAAVVWFRHGLSFAIVSMYLYSFGVGFVYWACTFPNHDTDMSEQSSLDEVLSKDADWGEHQIRHSSDFWMPDFLSYFIGGMNYQIEHHLFPSVHPRHYPALSKIVKEECEKRKVPYHVHSSWFNALKGNFKHLYEMSKSNKKD